MKVAVLEREQTSAAMTRNPDSSRHVILSRALKEAREARSASSEVLDRHSNQARNRHWRTGTERKSCCFLPEKNYLRFSYWPPLEAYLPSSAHPPPPVLPSLQCSSVRALEGSISCNLLRVACSLVSHFVARPSGYSLAAVIRSARADRGSMRGLI